MNWFDWLVVATWVLNILALVYQETKTTSTLLDPPRSRAKPVVLVSLTLAMIVGMLLSHGALSW